MILDASESAVAEAASVLRAGGIAIVPTERWYMVCTRAVDTVAIREIFRAKQRPLQKQPLFVLHDKNAASRYFTISSDAKLLIRELWPGDLSILLPWECGVASEFPGLDQTHALVNCPAGFLGDLAESLNEPLAATTVNIVDQPLGPAISLPEVLDFLSKSGLKPGTIINGGICPAFNHTTILDCRNASQTLLVREGYVHLRAINATLGFGPPKPLA